MVRFRSHRPQPVGLGCKWDVFVTKAMSHLRHVQNFRIRYSDIDQMGTYYNARVLEWFEWGRTELCRASANPTANGKPTASGCPWLPPMWNIATKRGMMTSCG